MTNKPTVEVTKEQFRAYRIVQMSGVTNMMDVKMASDLSGLDRETIFAIMNQYGTLKEEYPFSEEELDGMADDADDLRGGEDDDYE